MNLINSERDITLFAGKLKAIAHPSRLTIICLLAEGARCVQEIADKLSTTQPTVSQHLRILENRSFIKSNKVANRVYYSIIDPRVFGLIQQVRAIYCRKQTK